MNPEPLRSPADLIRSAQEARREVREAIVRAEALAQRVSRLPRAQTAVPRVEKH